MDAAAPPKVASAPPRLCIFRRGPLHGWGEKQVRGGGLPLSGPDGLVACQHQGDGLAGSGDWSQQPRLTALAVALVHLEYGLLKLHQRP